MKKVFLGFLVLAAIVLCIACSNERRSENVLTASLKSQDMNEPAKVISSDSYLTNNGELNVTLVGHGSLMFEYQGNIIHVDPYSNVAEYSNLPKADLIILTHEHSDHLDTTAINKIKKPETQFFVSQVCSDILGYGEVMNNGDTKTFGEVSIHAVPAYNMVNKNPQGEFYHPEGRGNGYVLSFGDKKVYVAGDTENIPEMKALKADGIYIAFLPKNLPYTMSDKMFIDAAINVSPVYLYPYHFSEFNEEKISKGLKNTDIKLLVRPMSNK